MSGAVFHEGTARELAGRIVSALRALDAAPQSISIHAEHDGLLVTAWVRGQLVAVLAPDGKPHTYQTIAVALLDEALKQNAKVADRIAIAQPSH